VKDTLDLTIISGGQTGADRSALEVALSFGLPTGGWAPKRFMTEDGPDPILGSRFGLLEHHSSDYADRTWANVQMADVTIWFGTIGSRGYVCTQGACQYFGKTMLENPTSQLLSEYIVSRDPRVMNVAGNRRSRNPSVAALVRETLGAALREVTRTKAGG
jgi:hypothetical protein